MKYQLKPIVSGRVQFDDASGTETKLRAERLTEFDKPEIYVYTVSLGKPGFGVDLSVEDQIELSNFFIRSVSRHDRELAKTFVEFLSETL